MSTKTREISNSDDIIDSRDVIARIEFLQNAAEGAEELGMEVEYDEREDLRTLVELAEQGQNSAEDWQYGATLIRDSYFVTYAQELAEDIGALPQGDSGWPAYCIDWEWAARELRMDDTSVDFDGVTYWVR